MKINKNTSGVLFATLLVVGLFYLFGFRNPTAEVFNINNQNIIQSTSSPEGSVLTMVEVSSHNTESDCYLVIKGGVYDVSSYISKHPGGRRNISTRCGSEVTGVFASIHSNRAWNLLADYKVGSIGQ